MVFTFSYTNTIHLLVSYFVLKFYHFMLGWYHQSFGIFYVDRYHCWKDWSLKLSGSLDWNQPLSFVWKRKLSLLKLSLLNSHIYRSIINQTNCIHVLTPVVVLYFKCYKILEHTWTTQLFQFTTLLYQSTSWKHHLFNLRMMFLITQLKQMMLLNQP